MSLNAVSSKRYTGCSRSAWVIWTKLQGPANLFCRRQTASSRGAAMLEQMIRAPRHEKFANHGTPTDPQVCHDGWSSFETSSDGLPKFELLGCGLSSRHRP